MKTRDISNEDVVAGQYKDNTNLEVRKNFHKKYSPNQATYAQRILSRIRFFTGCRVLEVGCGTGDLWEKQGKLVETFSELLLTDISIGMVDKAKERYWGRQNVKAQVVDVLDMPFEANSFDVIIANSMLYHVNDVDSVLENIQRTLRGEGVFCATTFGKNGQLSYINHAMFELGLIDTEKTDPISFTLENGEVLLRQHFSAVEEETYENRLEVTDAADLVDYIFSMASMSHIDRSNRDKMMAYFERKKDSRGILPIPTSYGIFICSK